MHKSPEKEPDLGTLNKGQNTCASCTEPVFQTKGLVSCSFTQPKIIFPQLSSDTACVAPQKNLNHQNLHNLFLSFHVGSHPTHILVAISFSQDDYKGAIHRALCAIEKGWSSMCRCVAREAGSGRWRSEMLSPQNYSVQRILQERLRKCHKDLATFSSQEEAKSWRAIGICMMSLWRLVPATGEPLTADMPANVDDRQLMHNIHYGNSLDYPQAVLEFPVLASAAFTEEKFATTCSFRRNRCFRVSEFHKVVVGTVDRQWRP